MRSFAVNEKSAYLMLPSISVCEGEVQQLLWSADGKRLLVKRSAVGMTVALLQSIGEGKKIDPNSVSVATEIWVWDSVSKKSRKCWSCDPRTAQVQTLQWLNGSDRFLLQVARGSERVDLLLVSSSNGEVKSVLSAPGSHWLSVVASPNRPTAAVHLGPAEGSEFSTVQLFSVASGLGAPITLPARMGQLMWDAEGRDLYGFALGPVIPGQRPSGEWMRLNPNRGSFQPADPPEEEKVTPELQVVNAPVPADPKVSAQFAFRIPSVLLFAGKPDDPNDTPGLVTTDGEKGLLSAPGTAVAYVHQGVAMVREIAKLPKEAYLAALAAAQRTEALMKAKQCGLALIMCAGDNDEALPSKEGWQDKIMPYLKNRAMMDGFNYTFAGGPMDQIKEPANTELGFITGPGGRAVVYADGHAKWVPN